MTKRLPTDVSTRSSTSEAPPEVQGAVPAVHQAGTEVCDAGPAVHQAVLPVQGTEPEVDRLLDQADPAGGVSLRMSAVHL
ncbi:hypothetical protein BDK51DRAFT_37233 [Blyttiomyces helicus]|uniref:Uncharacterized protein n=1 Tax=Blyttiomyces helicus TaxID=388810 RepID=A0A4P9WPD2_9FUNG|nr:hypothetical protein BDK51DRAFT_37233 [Blyttiomyces helicus]|eukprot:RKO93983.1 hypothetical protein BDK51DRAFT_37233 [Blyttiomyces helicus]